MQYIVEDIYPSRLTIGNPGTEITGFKDLKDILFLQEIADSNLPLYINYDFNAAIKKIYNQCLSDGTVKKMLLNKVSIKDDKNFYIYHCGPCDFWNGWAIVFMEDLIERSDLFTFTYSAMSLLEEHTNWELDFRDNLHLTTIPIGDEAGEWCLAIKQDNNGETFYVCRHKMLIENSDWGGLVYTPEGPVKKKGW